MDGHPDGRVKRTDIMRGAVTWAAPEVTLTRADLRQAYQVACERHFDDVDEGRQARFGGERGAALNHVQGTVGEMALAVYLELPWPGKLGDFGAPDAGTKGASPVQCRTVMEPLGPLWFYRWDEPKQDQPFCLAYWAGAYQVVLEGWLFGHELKKRGSWHAKTARRSAGWTLPPYDLRAPASLRAWSLKQMSFTPRRGDGIDGRHTGAASA